MRLIILVIGLFGVIGNNVVAANSPKIIEFIVSKYATSQLKIIHEDVDKIVSNLKAGEVYRFIDNEFNLVAKIELSSNTSYTDKIIRREFKKEARKIKFFLNSVKSSTIKGAPLDLVEIFNELAYRRSEYPNHKLEAVIYGNIKHKDLKIPLNDAILFENGKFDTKNKSKYLEGIRVHLITNIRENKNEFCRFWGLFLQLQSGHLVSCQSYQIHERLQKGLPPIAYQLNTESVASNAPSSQPITQAIPPVSNSAEHESDKKQNNIENAKDQLKEAVDDVFTSLEDANNSTTINQPVQKISLEVDVKLSGTDIMDVISNIESKSIPTNSVLKNDIQQTKWNKNPNGFILEPLGSSNKNKKNIPKLILDLSWENKDPQHLTDMDLILKVNETPIYYDKSRTKLGVHWKSRRHGMEKVELYELSYDSLVLIHHSNGPAPKNLLLSIKGGNNSLLGQLHIKGFQKYALYKSNLNNSMSKQYNAIWDLPTILNFAQVSLQDIKENIP